MTHNVRRIIAVLVIALLAGGATYFWFLPSTKPAPQSQTAPDTNKSQNKTAPNSIYPPVPPEPAEIYSYSGSVQSIDVRSGIIGIATDRGVKSVSVNEATAFFETTPLEVSARTAEERLNIDPQLKISARGMSALSIGTFIEAVSAANIQGRDLFIASKIIIIQ